MTLEKLQSDMIGAMKNSDEQLKDILLSSAPAIKRASIDKLVQDDVCEKIVDDVLEKEKNIVATMIGAGQDNNAALLGKYKYKMMSESMKQDCVQCKRMVFCDPLKMAMQVEKNCKDFETKSEAQDDG